jgi:hypothetical protein
MGGFVGDPLQDGDELQTLVCVDGGDFLAVDASLRV